MPQPAAGSRLGAAPTIVLSWTPPPQLTTARLTCLQRMEEVPVLQPADILREADVRYDDGDIASTALVHLASVVPSRHFTL